MTFAYDDARAVFLPLHDRRPAVIVRPIDAGRSPTSSHLRVSAGSNWPSAAVALPTSASDAMTSEAVEARSPWVAFGVLAIAVFLAILDQFIVNIAFPDIRRSFSSASLASLSWILSGYAIVFAAVLVPAASSPTSSAASASSLSVC
jgi:hypothetical protein